MYNGGKIIIGILIFCAIVVSPFVLGLIGAKAKPAPSIDTPVINAMAKKQCVESKDYMVTTHMQMLNNWRDAVVRDGKRLYTAQDGKQYDMSLQNTCMHCHSNKQKFCDECHTYVAVKPYCWDCHIAPKAADPYLKPVMVSGFPVSAKFLFEVGKAALPADADKASVAVIDYLKKDAAAKAVISGYTDQTGDAAKNAELAKARAFAVRDLLTKAGIAEGRIIMKKPELITGTGDNAQARRVEVNVVTGKGV